MLVVIKNSNFSIFLMGHLEKLDIKVHRSSLYTALAIDVIFFSITIAQYTLGIKNARKTHSKLESEIRKKNFRILNILLTFLQLLFTLFWWIELDVGGSEKQKYFFFS